LTIRSGVRYNRYDAALRGAILNATRYAFVSVFNLLPIGWQ